MKCVKFTAKVGANGDNLRLFLMGQLEHEIRGKLVAVTLDLLVQAAGGHPIRLIQIGVEHMRGSAGILPAGRRDAGAPSYRMLNGLEDVCIR